MPWPRLGGGARAGRLYLTRRRGGGCWWGRAAAGEPRAAGTGDQGGGKGWFGQVASVRQTAGEAASLLARPATQRAGPGKLMSTRWPTCPRMHRGKASPAPLRLLLCNCARLVVAAAGPDAHYHAAPTFQTATHASGCEAHDCFAAHLRQADCRGAKQLAALPLLGHKHHERALPPPALHLLPASTGGRGQRRGSVSTAGIRGGR